MSLILIVVLVVIILFIVITIVHLYNNLVSLRNRVKNSYSQIDVQLKRRNDLIPNLVETVKGYASHEKGVLEEVTQARAGVMNANGVEEVSAADNQLTGALKSLFAVAENYPDLKASSNFLQLQQALTKIENELQAARRVYNIDVTSYNTAIHSIPTNIVAGMMGFKDEPLFEISNMEAKENINVNI